MSCGADFANADPADAPLNGPLFIGVETVFGGTIHSAAKSAMACDDNARKGLASAPAGRIKKLDDAIEELDQACSLIWPELVKITPWGDSFIGTAPSGREVEVERRHLWAHEPEGAVAVEIEVRDVGARTGAEARALITPPR